MSLGATLASPMSSKAEESSEVGYEKGGYEKVGYEVEDVKVGRLVKGF